MDRLIGYNDIDSFNLIVYEVLMLANTGNEGRIIMRHELLNWVGNKDRPDVQKAWLSAVIGEIRSGDYTVEQLRSEVLSYNNA